MLEGEWLKVDREAAIPLATQISDQLRWLIASGEIEEGVRLPSVRALAKRLGVNLHTVRAAYARLEETGLVQTRHGSGTTVVSRAVQRSDWAARRLPSHTIGVLLPETNPFYDPMLSGIEDADPDHPWLPFLCNFREDIELAARYLDQLLAKNVDGVVITSVALSDEDPASGHILETASMVPTVFADVPNAPPPVVLFDLEGAGFQAASHLLQHGHRRIGFITPPTQWPNVAEVWRGIERAQAEFEWQIQPELIARVPDFAMNSGYEGAGRLMGISRPPSAILALDDKMAIGAMRAIKERGHLIPKDVALIGIGNIDMAAVVQPALTTASLPSYEMGVAAMTMLRQLISGEPLGEPRRVLEVELVVRESCGCGPAGRRTSS